MRWGGGGGRGDVKITNPNTNPNPNPNFNPNHKKEEETEQKKLFSGFDILSITLRHDIVPVAMLHGNAIECELYQF